MNIIQVPFPETQFFKQAFRKEQIVLHFTAGADNPKGVFDWWTSTPEKVATPYVIGRDGTIYQGYDAAYWAAHIGITVNNNISSDLMNYKTRANSLSLETKSVGIEICNWGPLSQVNGKFVNAYHGEVPADQVVEFKDGFRKYRFYHKFTDAQVQATRELLRALCDRFAIPSKYNADMWDLSGAAMAGKPGIWTHVNYHAGKFDCHPQENLVSMLKSI